MKKIILILFCTLFFVKNGISQNSYFEIAKERIIKYNPQRKDLVIIVDYRYDINTKRLFILDMNKNEVVLSSTVAHARKSGLLYVKNYSNTHGTNMSSKGNFITRGTRYGSFGYSMVLDGLDKGINDNANSRRIIFHSNKKMKTKWSYGCFATPEDINKKIINMTKNGVLVCVID